MENNKVEDLIKIMSDKLESITKSYMEYKGMIDYIEMAECTSWLLDQVFGEGKYQLPIDIEKVVRYLEIEVAEINLNDDCDENLRRNRIVGELSIRPQIFSDGVAKRIYIDSETTLYTQRYALAHEMGHYLFNKNKMLFNDEYCTMPMLPKDAEELVADAFAVSLLIPIKVFIKEFVHYLEAERTHGNLPISTEDWLQYLSTSSRVSSHYVACGYQQLRCVAHWLFKYKSDKDKVVSMRGEEREILLMKLKEQEARYTVLTKDIEVWLTDEIVELLFQ